MVMCFVACGEDEEPSGDTTPSRPQSTASSKVPTADSSKPTTGSSDTPPSSGTTDSSGTTGSSDVPPSSGTTGSSDVPSSSETTGSSGTDDPGDNPPQHQHTFEDTYTYDKENHYFKATCEHTGEVKDLAPHSIDPTTGKCVCGYTVDTMESILAEIMANRGLITNGKIDREAHNLELESITLDKYSYKFYEDYVYIREIIDYTNDYYYALDRNGEIFGIMIQDGKIGKDTETYEENLNGVHLNFVFLNDNDTHAYGAEDFLQKLYNIGLAAVTKVTSYEKQDGSYCFTFADCVVDNWMNYYYVVTAEFAVSEADRTLKTASVIVNRYANSQYTVENGVYTLNDDAQPNHTYNFAIEQSSEAITYIPNPYDPKTMVVESFILTDRGNNDISDKVMNVSSNGEVKILFQEMSPATANLALSEITITIIDNSTGHSAVFSMPYFNPYDNSYSFTMGHPGTYSMTVTVDDIEITSTIDVEMYKPTEISSQVYDSALGDFTPASKTTVFLGAPVHFTSLVSAYTDAGFVAELVHESLNGIAELTETEINGIKAYTFKASSIGVYKIKLTSTSVSSVGCVMEIVVTEAPDVEEVLDGEFVGNNKFGIQVVSAIFDKETGEVKVTYVDVFGEMTEVLTFAVTDGAFSYEHKSGDDFVSNLYLTDSMEIYIEIFEEETYLLSKPLKNIVASGSLVLEDIFGGGALSGTYTFEIDENGIFTIYKDGVVFDSIAITDNGTELSVQLSSLGYPVTVPKSEGVPTGTYDVIDYEDKVATITITLDTEEEQEPIKGTIAIADKLSSEQSVTYTYEYFNGIFTLYLGGEAVDETKASLTMVDGTMTLLYPGLLAPKELIKVGGAAGEIAGEYKIEMDLGATQLVAVVVITSDENILDSEKELPSGILTLEDNTVSGIGGIYTYEIIDGVLVFYKDGVVVNDFAIAMNDDGTYTLSVGATELSAVILKVAGAPGALTGTYRVNTPSNGAFVLTFTAGEVEFDSVDEELWGEMAVTDNREVEKGLSGIYAYEVNGDTVVIYKNGDVISYITVAKAENGAYTFTYKDASGTYGLIKKEGNRGALTGAYNVVSNGEVIFEITFTAGKEVQIEFVETGSLEITDNDTNTVGGSYTYGVNSNGTIFIYKDGVRVNNISVVGALGSYTFECDALEATALKKVRGNATKLMGKYQVLDGSTVKYELLFIKNVEGEEPVDTEVQLSVGENSVAVSTGTAGVTATFTTSVSAVYEIQLQAGETNAYIVYKAASGREVVLTFPSEITLKAGDSMVIHITSANYEADVIDLFIKLIKKTGELADDEF